MKYAAEGLMLLYDWVMLTLEARDYALRLAADSEGAPAPAS